MPRTSVFPSYNAFLASGKIPSTRRKGMHGSCPICLEDFICTGPIKGRMRVTIRHCKHTFHSGCLYKWFEEHSTCPMCRAKLFPKKVKVWRRMCEVARVDGLGSEILTCDEVWELGKDLDEQGEEIKRFLALKPVCVEVWEEEE
jgi:hypothetical protein